MMSTRGMPWLVGLIGVAVACLMATGCSPSSRKVGAVLWIGGFAHDFETPADILTEALQEQIPIEIEVVRDGSFLNATGTQKPDVILMHHCHKSVKDIITEQQQQKLLELVRSGVGVVGIHASYYSFLEWDEYHEFYGTRFIKHGDSKAVLVVRTVDGRHPVTKGLAESFEVVSELYESEPLAQDCHVLARAKEKGSTAEHPSVWTRLYGKGRIVTILPGHWPDSYRVPDFQKLIASGALWAADRCDIALSNKPER